MSIYDIEVPKTNGETYKLEAYKDYVILIVNTASECVVLGFPCNQFGKQEPGSGEEATQNCKINYGVSFPMHEKIKVNGPEQHPLYQHLKQAKNGFLGEKIKWNFTKFLINRDGEVINRFAPQKKPSQLESSIEALL